MYAESDLFWMTSSAYSGMRVTHMVGCNLSGSKADKVLKVWGSGALLLECRPYPQVCALFRTAMAKSSS